MKEFSEKYNGFFHTVLNKRLVDNGEHLFRHRLGGGQESRAEARNGQNGLAQRLDHDGVPPGLPGAGGDEPAEANISRRRKCGVSGDPRGVR